MTRKEKRIKSWASPCPSPWKLIVELKREAITEILRLNTWERTRQVDSFLEALFPKCIGEQLKVSYSHPKFCSVFYLEPEKPIYTEGSSMRDVAIDILAMLDQKDKAPEPHMFLDIILFHDIGIGSPETNLLAVRSQQFITSQLYV